MATTHIQGSVSTITAATSGTAALTVAPTVGNLVCVGVILSGSTPSASALSIKDTNGNAYAITPNSPSQVLTGNSAVWLAWWHAASIPSRTLNLSWVTTTNAAIWIDEFSHSGNCKFDQDVFAPKAGTGTTINTPTITPTLAGSLVYACGSSGGTITAPTAGATLGAWTGVGGAITNGNMCEYILSQAASNIALDFTQNNTTWNSGAMSFLLDFSGHLELESGTGNLELENATGDLALET